MAKKELSIGEVIQTLEDEGYTGDLAYVKKRYHNLKQIIYIYRSFNASVERYEKYTGKKYIKK